LAVALLSGDTLMQRDDRAAHVEGIDGCGTYIWDARNGAVTFSRGAAALFGPGAAPADIDAWTCAIHPDDRDRAHLVKARMGERTGAFDVEYRLRRDDGDVIYVHDRGTVTGDRTEGLIIDVSRQRSRRLADADRTHLPEFRGVGLYEYDVTTGLSWWSAEIFRLVGIPAVPLIDPYSVVMKRVHPEDRDRVAAGIGAALEQVGPYQFDSRICRDDGTIVHVRDRGEAFGPLDPATGLARWVRGTLTDRTEMVRLETARPDAQHLRSVLDNTLAMIGLLDTDGTLVEANATAMRTLDPADTAIGCKFWDSYWWAGDPDRVARLKQAVAAAASGETVRYDTDVRVAGNRTMTIDFMVSPVIEPGGTVRQLIASAFDITPREQALDHARLLMREINHRSKNVLTLVQSVARLTKRDNVEDFLRRFENRLSALGASYDLLLDESAGGAELRALAKRQFAHFKDLVGSRITLAGPQVILTAEAAQALGMAFHELATNAGKYGALSSDDGRVDIRWCVDADQVLSLSWSETGGPPVTPPARTGFGSMVLGPMAESGLGADVHVDYRPEGLHWSIRCDGSAQVIAALPGA
jgi:PAS domain S-box-containing protein